MKSLDEKKLLARMARNIGQPDLALEESIRTEENLSKNLFKNPSKSDEKPVIMQVLTENNLFINPPRKQN